MFVGFFSSRDLCTNTVSWICRRCFRFRRFSDLSDLLAESNFLFLVIDLAAKFCIRWRLLQPGLKFAKRCFY